MHNSAKYLAYAGLIPFVSMPILVMIGLMDAYLGYLYFVQYSAIILSFFGGIHWLDAIQNRRNGHQLYVSMLPSITAWISLIFLSGTMLLSVLSIAYISILLYDKFVLAMEKDILLDYTKLRMQLTTVVVLSHLFMAYN